MCKRRPVASLEILSILLSISFMNLLETFKFKRFWTTKTAVEMSYSSGRKIVNSAVYEYGREIYVQTLCAAIRTRV